MCLEYQIGNCLGPCEGLQSEEDYMESIQHIRYLLKGNLKEVSRHLKTLMKTASEETHFEKAHLYKQKIEHLQKYQAKSTIVSHTVGNVDVFHILKEGNYAFANFLRVSNGIIVQTRNIELRSKLDETEKEILLTAIAEVHNLYGAPNKQLILPFNLDLEDDPF